MIKRILFLAPYSVPVNNPEAICNAKLIKVLSEAGYELDVISKNNNHAYAPDACDHLFVDKVCSIKTFVLKNKVNLRTIIDHCSVFLKTGYVYKGAHWAKYAIREAERLIKQKKYDLIMSRSPASELAALYLSQRYKIRWIANWNDPYPDQCYPEPYGKGPRAGLGRMQYRLLKQVVRKADLHTFPCERLKNYMLQYMGLQEVKSVTVIPHVCLDNLFPYKQKTVSSLLRVIHSGNVSLPRSPITLFAGLKLFKQKIPGAAFEVAFMGKQDQDFRNLVQVYGLEDHIKLIPPQDYISNLKIMSEYDLALLIEADMNEGIFLPTKVGDYMQCRLPVWALSPDNGEMKDLYLEGKISYFSDVASAEGIAKVFEKIYTEYLTGDNKLPEVTLVNEYSGACVLRQYETIFEKMETVCF